MSLLDCLEPSERIALRDSSRSLTYRELDESSNKVRNYILTQALVSRRVGLKIEMSVDAVICLWGILKAGCAYVPLQGKLPAKRVATIRSELALDLVLDQLEWDETDRQVPTGNAEAYVFTTSGTTGVPKFIPVTHEASLAFVNWASELVSVKNVVNISPLSFDISVFDIFVTAKQQGCLFVPDETEKLFPKALLKIISDNAIDTIYSTPSFLGRLSTPLSRIDSLTTIIFAGEAFNTEKFREIYTPEKTYFNFYGPTETNVCFFHRVDDPDFLPIGKPCPYITFKIESGQLFVKGDSVYLGNTVWYATGDIVEQQRDVLVFRGRLDHQVKRQGYRINLDEIRNVALSSRNVKEVQVQFTDQKITLVYSGTKFPIRPFIGEFLPSYMLPDECIHRKKLTLSAHGKIS